MAPDGLILPPATRSATRASSPNLCAMSPSRWIAGIAAAALAALLFACSESKPAAPPAPVEAPAASAPAPDEKARAKDADAAVEQQLEEFRGAVREDYGQQADEILEESARALPAPSLDSLRAERPDLKLPTSNDDAEAKRP